MNNDRLGSLPPNPSSKAEGWELMSRGSASGKSPSSKAEGWQIDRESLTLVEIAARCQLIFIGNLRATRRVIKTMITMLNIAFSCYLITAIVSILFGIIYLTRSEFMPYHAVALEQKWTDLDLKLQTLILALMRVAGGGFLATGMVVILLMLIYLKTTEVWILFVIPIISLVITFSSLYATLLVKTRTPGLPPVNLTIISIVLILLGFVLSIFTINT